MAIDQIIDRKTMESTLSPPALDRLDADELFMLGLKASTAGDSGSALACLKLCIAKAPDHARAHWALAAEYAALRMPERATTHFARAVELDPAQPVARFQYGLLRLTSGDTAGAESIWAPLDALSEEDPVRRFKRGLLHMVRDQFHEALALIQAASDDPAVDPALRNDMQMIIARIESARTAGVAGRCADPSHTAPAATPAVEDRSVQSHLAFTAYASGGGRH